MYRKLWLLGLLLAVMGLLAACDASPLGIAAEDLPDYVQYAPPRVQEAYHFAMTHPDMLTHQPCYCGCGPMGHLNALDCFIREFEDSGAIIFDNHASGCGICVDIALDVKRLAAEGKSQLQIRLYIDATYSAFGPSTDTPMPEA